MICPSCAAATEVKDSRPRDEGRSLRRRRKCMTCGHRFTTVEVPVPDEVKLMSSTGLVAGFLEERALQMAGLALGNRQIVEHAKELFDLLTLITADDRRLLVTVGRRLADATEADREQRERSAA